jgi:hypothetical protein
MIQKLKNLTRDFNLDVKKLKKLIIEKKATVQDIYNLKKIYVVKLLQVIFKRK